MSRGGADTDTAAGVAEALLPSREDEGTAETTPAATPAVSATADRENTAPPPAVDLHIRLNPDPSLGFCVYAGRPFARGECLFRERTALEATHDVDPRGVRNVYDRYCRLSAARRDALHGSFPVLAWANGVDAAEAAAARTLIGSRLLTKRCTLDIAVTAAEHMQMRPDHMDAAAAAAAGIQVHSVPLTPTSWSRAARNFLFRRKQQLSPQADGSNGAAAAAVAAAAPPSTSSSTSSSSFSPSPEAARRYTLDWFSRYAFRLKPGSAFTDSAQGGHHQAAVYLLTDLINHRCAGFQNCRVAAEVGAISVLAVRDIAAGEEVTINYSKDIKDFQCKGECCVRK